MTETFAFLDSEDRQVLEKMVKEKAEFKKINDFLELKLEDYAKIKEKAKRLLDQEMGNVFQNL